jgi:hypothetical protein
VLCAQKSGKMVLSSDKIEGQEPILCASAQGGCAMLIEKTAIMPKAAGWVLPALGVVQDNGPQQAHRGNNIGNDNFPDGVVIASNGERQIEE